MSCSFFQTRVLVNRCALTKKLGCVVFCSLHHFFLLVEDIFTLWMHCSAVISFTGRLQCITWTHTEKPCTSHCQAHHLSHIPLNCPISKTSLTSPPHQLRSKKEEETQCTDAFVLQTSPDLPTQTCTHAYPHHSTLSHVYAYIHGFAVLEGKKKPWITFFVLRYFCEVYHLKYWEL